MSGNKARVSQIIGVLDFLNLPRQYLRGMEQAYKLKMTFYAPALCSLARSDLAEWPGKFRHRQFLHSFFLIRTGEVYRAK